MSIYWPLPIELPMECCIPVNKSDGDCATLLDGDPGLNLLVISSVKSSEKNPRHLTIATFLKNDIIHRRYGLYMPTEIEIKLFPLVKITDKKIPSVFADFLVVYELYKK